MVRGPPCRPAGTRTGASAAIVRRRTSRHVGCTVASPKPTSVTQPQRGGLLSSVELVDILGSSFRLRQPRVRRLLLTHIQYLPRFRPCEPHANWEFANVLFRRCVRGRTSHDRRLGTTRLHLRSQHGAPGTEGQHHRGRHRRLVRNRHRNRPRALPPWARGDLGGSPGGPVEGPGRGAGAVARRTGGGDPGRPHRRRFPGGSAGKDRDPGPRRRRPGQQRRLHDDGRRRQGRPCGRARAGAHQRRGRGRPVHDVRAGDGDASIAVPS